MDPNASLLKRTLRQSRTAIRGGPGTHPDIDVREEWARTSERVIDRRGERGLQRFGQPSGTGSCLCVHRHGRRSPAGEHRQGHRFRTHNSDVRLSVRARSRCRSLSLGKGRGPEPVPSGPSAIPVRPKEKKVTACDLCSRSGSGAWLIFDRAARRQRSRQGMRFIIKVILCDPCLQLVFERATPTDRPYVARSRLENGPYGPRERAFPNSRVGRQNPTRANIRAHHDVLHPARTATSTALASFVR